METNLTRKAIEEIVREMHERSKLGGQPQQERKLNPLGKPNKQFLGRTINSVLTHNKRQMLRTQKNCRQKLEELNNVRYRQKIERLRDVSSCSSSCDSGPTEKEIKSRKRRKRKTKLKHVSSNRRPSTSSLSDAKSEDHYMSRKKNVTNHGFNLEQHYDSNECHTNQQIYSDAANRMAMLATANHMQHYLLMNEMKKTNVKTDQDMDREVQKDLCDTSSASSMKDDGKELLTINVSSSMSSDSSSSSSSIGIIDCLSSSDDANNVSEDRKTNNFKIKSSPKANKKMDKNKSLQSNTEMLTINVEDSSSTKSSPSHSPSPSSSSSSSSSPSPPSKAQIKPKTEKLPTVVNIDLDSTSDTSDAPSVHSSHSIKTKMPAKMSDNESQTAPNADKQPQSDIQEHNNGDAKSTENDLAAEP